MNNIPLLTLIWSLELNPAETLFLAHPADCADEHAARILIPAERLALDSRLSICTVRRYLAKWQAYGVLIVTRNYGHGRPKQYAMNVAELEAMQRRVREAKDAQILRLVLSRDAHSGRARRAALTIERSGWLEAYHATSAKSREAT